MRVSVIIATYNAESTVKKCIESIFSQSYSDIEVVVMDGGSSDRTVEYVNSFQSPKIIIRSKRDKGIYDAWNKGIEAATGDWLVFIGADDYLASSEAIKNALELISSEKSDPQQAIYYGRLLVLDEAGVAFDGIGSEWLDPWSFAGRHKWCQFPIPIMAAFYHKSCFLKNRFDVNYKIMADINLVLSVARKRAPKYIGDINITEMGFGGISTNPKRSLLLLREAIAVRKYHGLSIFNVQFAILSVKLFLKYAITTVFGPKSGIRLVGLMHKIKRMKLKSINANKNHPVTKELK